MAGTGTGLHFLSCVVVEQCRTDAELQVPLLLLLLLLLLLFDDTIFFSVFPSLPPPPTKES